ncbi:hypothetical protein AM490_28970 [Pseudomonas aeruginosa]|nr:hypothetical protein AM490_28970 [Pseudomonas aeruginosa]
MPEAEIHGRSPGIFFPAGEVSYLLVRRDSVDSEIPRPTRRYAIRSSSSMDFMYLSTSSSS